MSKDAPPKENLTNSRYTDLVGEPVERFLSPIKGYEATPLVSLEEAVKYISHLFDGIEENVWIAKNNTKNPAHGLTQDESAAIHLYTMQFDTDPSFYQLLNSTLRGENRDNLKPWFAYLKLFLTALHKLPSHPQTIWRGVRGVDLSSQYPPGSKFAWWGVSSCTTSLEVLQAETFLGKKGIRTLFSLESQNGKIIVPHSYFKDTEKEIVLMPGTYFEVMGQLNAADDLYIIQLKELDPPFAFVKPPFKKEVPAPKVSKPSDDVVPPTTNFNENKQSMNSSTAEPNVMPERTNMNMFTGGFGGVTMPNNILFGAGGAAQLPFAAAQFNPWGGGPTFSMSSIGTSMYIPQVLSNQGTSSTTASAQKASDVRIVKSTMQPQMQEFTINVIQNAIVEGTDEDDIKSIIVDELIRKYGGTWWANVTPKTETHGSLPRKLFLAIKIDKYAVSVIQA